MAVRAIQYLRRNEQVIAPRKQWPPSKALQIYDFSGRIKENFQAESGRALSLWGDAGWGELVKQGKYRDNRFDEALVRGAVEMIQRWQPQPMPTGVTYVPSLYRPELVPDFAMRLAEKLGLPLLEVVQKVRHNKPQKNMSNSYQKTRNLDGVFAVDAANVRQEPAFLVDDVVDSRWTFTVIAALLRRAGSGKVFPLALALNSLE